jgi:methionyl-tRNA formyltransferase
VTSAGGLRRRLAYFGTPTMAVEPLRALVAAGHDIAIVITRPDTRRGRGGETSPSPVKAAALELGLEVSHVVDDVLGRGVELGVVVAYGQLIRPHVLAEVPMVNLHFSLLPRWRGAAPVERAILAGDTETGVCLMRLEEGLDTGPVLDTVRVPIGASTTADELRRDLVRVGSEMLVRDLAADLPAAVAQHGEPTYAAKLTADDLHIDWSSGADRVVRVVRLGGAWTTFRGKRLKVLDAEVAAAPGHGVFEGVRMRRVQPEGKGPMAYDDWLRGVRPTVDERFE